MHGPHRQLDSALLCWNRCLVTDVRPWSGLSKGDPMEPRVFAHSQTYRLRERMTEADIRHAQEVRADLTGIRVSAAAENWRIPSDGNVGAIFFCTMGPIRI